MVLNVTRKQWPVGQGCLSSGSIELDGQYFEYIYDCGSDNLSELKSSISALRPKNGVIDALFISHLDRDHVNGIEYLLGSELDVDTVYLPYLNMKEIVLACSRALADNFFTRNFVNLLTNPAKWFGERGVKTLVYVSRYPDEGEGGEGNQFSDPPSFKELFPINQDHNDSNRVMQVSSELPSLMSDGGDEEASVLSLSPNADIGLSKQGHVDWILIPYVPPMIYSSLTSFFSEIRKLGIDIDDASTNIAKLLEILQDKSKRKKLRDAYSMLSKKHNDLSLCLYSGPLHKHFLDYSTNIHPFERRVTHEV